MGGQRERFASFSLPDTPGDHFLDTMEVTTTVRKMGVTIQTNLPRNGWHNQAVALANE